MRAHVDRPGAVELLDGRRLGRAAIWTPRFDQAASRPPSASAASSTNARRPRDRSLEKGPLGVELGRERLERGLVHVTEREPVAPGGEQPRPGSADAGRAPEYGYCVPCPHEVEEGVEERHETEVTSRPRWRRRRGARRRRRLPREPRPGAGRSRAQRDRRRPRDGTGFPRPRCRRRGTPGSGRARCSRAAVRRRAARRRHSATGRPRSER